MPLSAQTLVVDAGRPVHVTDFGGPAGAPGVMLVHGLGSSSLGWTAVARLLVPSHRVLAIDLPGHGRTPAEGRPFSMTDSAALLESVLEAAGVGPVTLVGHSLGAAVSILTAARAPALLDRMLLLAPPLPRTGLPTFGVAMLPHVALCLCPSLGRRLLQRRSAGQDLEDLVLDRLRLTRARVEDLTELADLAGAMAADLRAAMERGEDPLDCFLDAARSVGLLVTTGSRYRAAIQNVRAPVHVVHGEHDRILRPSGLRQLETLQPQWRTHLLPDVGHSPHLETPLTIARMIIDLAAGGDRSATSEPQVEHGTQESA